MGEPTFSSSPSCQFANWAAGHKETSQWRADQLKEMATTDDYGDGKTISRSMASARALSTAPLWLERCGKWRRRQADSSLRRARCGASLEANKRSTTLASENKIETANGAQSAASCETPARQLKEVRYKTPECKNENISSSSSCRSTRQMLQGHADEEWRRQEEAAAGKLARRQPALISPGASVRLLLAAIAIIALAHWAPVALSVECFKCSSRNGTNPACEDPFHNLNTTRVQTPTLPDPLPNVVYHAPCYAGKKGRDGLFPASACIKLTGVFDATGETLVVRHCALDSGTLTQDTELARMSHCGTFQFEGDQLKGCVLSCPEDACNSANAEINLSSTTSARRLALAGAVLALLSMVLHARAISEPRARWHFIASE